MKLLLDLHSEAKIANLSYIRLSATQNYALTPTGSMSLFSCWVVWTGITDAGVLMLRMSVTAQILHSVSLPPYLFQKRITVVKGEKMLQYWTHLLDAYDLEVHSCWSPDRLIFGRKHKGRALRRPPPPYRDIFWEFTHVFLNSISVTLDEKVLNLPFACCMEHSLQ